MRHTKPERAESDKHKAVCKIKTVKQVLVTRFTYFTKIYGHAYITKFKIFYSIAQKNGGIPFKIEKLLNVKVSWNA